MAVHHRATPSGGHGPRHRIPTPPRLGAKAAYGLALALPLVAFVVQLTLPGLFELTPFLLLALALPVVAWTAGPRPAMVAVVWSSFLGWLFLSMSAETSHRSGAALAVLAFLPVGALVAFLGSLVRSGFQEREQSSQALREGEHLYRTLFDLAPYGVALMAPDGRFVAFNTAAHRDLGYTREEFTRLTVADLEAEEDPVEIRRHIDSIQATGAGDFTGHHRT